MRICDYECTGCGACESVCPLKCITMKIDKQGFIIPVINVEICIKCGKCKRVCPVNNIQTNNFIKSKIQAYSFTNNNNKVLKESSSGGAFSAIAEKIIDVDGIVYGAAYDKEFNVAHIGVENKEDLFNIRGSKYVESNTNGIYVKIKAQLEQGKTVLFTGTPCQIAGLYASLENNTYENLYTIDILCHGVPSTTLFKEYIETLQKKYGKIISYTFRDKTKWGWGNWGSFTYINSKNCLRKKYFVVANDYFYSLFFKECIFRESCYECKYAKIPRIGDVTIGDCWGIENIDSQADLENGVSLILINNEKGKKLIDNSIKKDLLKQMDIKDMINYNKTIIQATKRPDSRNDFYNDFIEKGFKITAKKYCKLKKIMPIVSRYIPRGLKRSIKELLKRRNTK